MRPTPTALRIRGDPRRVLIDQVHRYGATLTGHLESGCNGSVNPTTAINMGIDRIECFLGR